MNVTLTVTAGPHIGREFVFDRHDTFLVGRAREAHFQLSSDDPFFSRRHFLVEVNPPRVRVFDLNSRNGIAVNGVKVRDAELNDGDQLKAGHTIFRVSVPRSAQSTEPSIKQSPLQSPPHSPVETIDRVPGLLIPGYKLELELGRGAMGVVYRATREADGQPVAVKIIPPAEGVPQSDVDRFLREARIMAELRHRHVVRCFDSGESNGLLYLAMELVTGPDLQQRVKERGPMEVGPAVRLMLHALDGLGHAHEKGFVHRDVKPSNLLLDGPKDRRVVKVADFGLARAYNEYHISGLTMQGEVGGTPAFMPPEQVMYYREVKPAADQYSAAATLYYLLTGQYVLNFEPSRPAQMIQIATDPRVPIQFRRADVPDKLAAVIHKALSLDPVARYTDTVAFRDTLRPFG